MHEIVKVDYTIKRTKAFHKEGNIIRKGKSTVVEAMKFAVEEGATTLILCGIDMGSVDGEAFVFNYHGIPSLKMGEYMEKDNLNPQVTILEDYAKELREQGLIVCSINPFINMGLEGHSYNSLK